MRTVRDLESAVARLRAEELKEFRQWFLDFDGRVWDEEIERDAAAGRLDRLAGEALADLRNGKCSGL